MNSKSIEYGCPTVMRHPRSLAEAFPDMRAGWLEGPDRVKNVADTCVAVALWFAGIAVGVLLMVQA